MPVGSEQFEARLRDLEDDVGSGKLSGTVERDQAYAQYQHEELGLAHPHGGQAKYQETALHAHYETYLQGVADHVLDGGIEQAMAEQMERLDQDSAELTPKDLTILARSGHPVVRSGTAVVYDRTPEVPRLSAEELNDLHSKVRGFTNRPGGA
jgi:hypothetical protein